MNNDCNGCYGASMNDCQRCDSQSKHIIEQKNCCTCVSFDYGICDLYGKIVQDDDSCKKHRFDWKEKLLQRFIGNSRR